MNILSLPDDVLCTIFERAVPPPHDMYRLTHYRQLLKISHICRAWRQLALSNAHFWASIIRAMKEQQVLRTDIRLFSLFLERSANALLDFSTWDILEPVSTANFLAWYGIISRKQPYWRKVDMWVDLKGWD